MHHLKTAEIEKSRTEGQNEKEEGEKEEEPRIQLHTPPWITGWQQKRKKENRR